eukprot:11188828-Lingulodinium_polyedra.AAC.1
MGKRAQAAPGGVFVFRGPQKPAAVSGAPPVAFGPTSPRTRRRRGARPLRQAPAHAQKAAAAADCAGEEFARAGLQ